MPGPLSFMPERHELDDVPIDMHNKVVEENGLLREELKRARQKIAHLIREMEDLKAK